MAVLAAVQDGAVLRGAGPAARVPDGAALEVHLLAVAERVAALGAARARGVEVVVVAGLQHLARDVAAAVRALDAELLLVVLLAVRHAVLAHVLAVQNGVARLALEAPDVPLAVQRDQGLALLELLVAARALVGAQRRARARGAGGGAGRGAVAMGGTHGDLHAAGAQHLLARVRDALARREGLPAASAGEALLVVRVAEGSHHLALHVLAAHGALGAELPLVVRRAVVGAILAEEAALGQRVAAHFTLEASDVEVLVLHAQHLSGAFFLTALAVRLPFGGGGRRGLLGGLLGGARKRRLLVRAFEALGVQQLLRALHLGPHLPLHLRLLHGELLELLRP